ncbi:hypothetical protein SLS62_002457 [Diatrype stigma]|uniref:Efflux pump antibiotic resistance protein n=1 Tax=Diatrype stigma TaxID=117547 RepID=A0AAN9YVN1_9PEZI
MARTPGSQAPEGLKVINASLFRMGTKSMSEAYKILGYRTHHALDNVMDNPWGLVEKAAEAKWPKTSKGGSILRPFTRHDWDAVWGPYEVVTDLASPFAPDLIKCYPEAKVVIVRRDFETWWPSFQTELLDRFFNTQTAILAFIGSRVFGMRSAHALRNIYYGFFDARNVHEIQDHARAAYDRYFEEIRELVPPERRLEYRMGSGWEPLCTFLGKEVPDVEFPFVNSRDKHGKEIQTNTRNLYLMFLKLAMLWGLGATAVVCVAWYLSEGAGNWAR